MQLQYTTPTGSNWEKPDTLRIHLSTRLPVVVVSDCTVNKSPHKTLPDFGCIKFCVHFLCDFYHLRLISENQSNMYHVIYKF